MGRVVSRRKIEMVWRCSSCQHQNRGRDKQCTACGNPKDASEHFEMPGSTAAAPSVADPALLRLANAGPDWRCGYCGSDQRRLDNTCGQCGASIDDGRTPAPKRLALSAGSSAPTLPSRFDYSLLKRAALVFGSAIVVGLALFCGLGWWLTRPFEAVVQGSRWEHEVVVERYRVQHGEGFAESRPAGAFDVAPGGQRHHHDEQVLDHYRTEHYTEQVACGQDCTSVPETCSEHCSPDGNGFATCETVCTGGGQSCSTRYCSEARTREVPVYRSEPRYATWYTWRVWAWTPDRTLRRAGQGAVTEWPTDQEIALDVGVGEGERERAERRGRYYVALRDEDGDTFELRPTEEREFSSYAPGQRIRVRPTREANVVELAPAE